MLVVLLYVWVYTDSHRFNPDIYIYIHTYTYICVYVYENIIADIASRLSARADYMLDPKLLEDLQQRRGRYAGDAPSR